MNYGYMRVSTDKQDYEHQRMAIFEYANKENIGRVEFVSEIISSRKSDRKIFSLIESLVKGDVLIIVELSRLGRSLRELESIRVKIAEKGATIHAINQKLVITPEGDDIMTKTLIFMFELSAQIERQMISDRTKSALQVRRSKGLPMGRPKGISKLDQHAESIAKYRDIGLNYTAIAKLCGCNRQTIVNWLNRK